MTTPPIAELRREEERSPLAVATMTRGAPSLERDSAVIEHTLGSTPDTAFRAFRAAWREIRDHLFENVRPAAVQTYLQAAKRIATCLPDARAGERIEELCSVIRERMSPPLSLHLTHERVDGPMWDLHELMLDAERTMTQHHAPLTQLQKLGGLHRDHVAHMSNGAMLAFLGAEGAALGGPELQALQIVRLYAMGKCGHNLLESGFTKDELETSQAYLALKSEEPQFQTQPRLVRSANRFSPTPMTDAPDIRIVDRPVAVALDSKSLLEAICALERACTVPEQALIDNTPAKGIYFAHVVSELREVLESQGAQILLYEETAIRQGEKIPRVWGIYVYDTDEREICREDRKLYDRAKEFLTSLDGFSLKVGIAHMVCIDERVNKILHAQGLNRFRVYMEMHAKMVEEAMQQRIDCMVATCRTNPAPNPCREGAHAPLGWGTLADGEFGLRTNHRLSNGDVIVIESMIMALFVAGPEQGPIQEESNGGRAQVEFKNLDDRRTDEQWRDLIELALRRSKYQLN